MKPFSLERLVPLGGLDAAVESWVKSLVACGPRAVRIQKRLIMDWDRMSPTEAARAGIQAFVDAYRTDEPKRYINNFLNHSKH
jgi:enoyl-CoA hydratase